jgi:hypothetical protein
VRHDRHDHPAGPRHRLPHRSLRPARPGGEPRLAHERAARLGSAPGRRRRRGAGDRPGRDADATITLDPPDAGEDADWLHAISWQGGSRLVIDELEQTGPSIYRTTEPLPVDGTWKTLLRLHEGNSLTSLPIYLPADPAIPAEGVPANGNFEREFEAEKEFLQREATTDGGVLQAIAYVTVLAITLSFLGLVAWARHRLAVTAQTTTDGRPSISPARPRPRAALRTAGAR